MFPLVQQVPRRDGDAVVLATPEGRDMRLDGDADWLLRVLGHCNGRTPVAAMVAAEGEDAGALVGVLVEHGVAVDGAQAWRHFHVQSSVGSGLGFAPTPERLLQQLDERFEPVVLDGERVDLDGDETEVGRLAGTRRSTEAGDAPRPVTFAELSAVLRAMYVGDGRRPVPSPGSLYSLVIHVAVRDEEPPGPGLWWLDPASETLALVRRDADPAPVILPHPVTDPFVHAGEPVIFVSADLARASEKYGNRGYRLTLLEAGAAMQNAYLAATELGVPVRAIGGIDDIPAAAFLDLQPPVVPLLAILLGA